MEVLRILAAILLLPCFFALLIAIASKPRRRR